MKNFFMIEWWDAGYAKYQQEYFHDLRNATERYCQLERDVPLSIPEITTCRFQDFSPEGF